MWEQLRMHHSLELKVFRWKDFKRTKKIKIKMKKWLASVPLSHTLIHLDHAWFVFEGKLSAKLYSFIIPKTQDSKIFFSSKGRLAFFLQNVIWKSTNIAKCVAGDSPKETSDNAIPGKLHTNRVYGCKFILSEERLYWGFRNTIIIHLKKMFF